MAVDYLKLYLIAVFLISILFADLTLFYYQEEITTKFNNINLKKILNISENIYLNKTIDYNSQSIYNSKIVKENTISKEDNIKLPDNTNNYSSYDSNHKGDANNDLNLEGVNDDKKNSFINESNELIKIKNINIQQENEITRLNNIINELNSKINNLSNEIKDSDKTKTCGRLKLEKSQKEKRANDLEKELDSLNIEIDRRASKNLPYESLENELFLKQDSLDNLYISLDEIIYSIEELEC